MKIKFDAREIMKAEPQLVEHGVPEGVVDAIYSAASDHRSWCRRITAETERLETGLAQVKDGRDGRLVTVDLVVVASELNAAVAKRDEAERLFHALCSAFSVEVDAG